DRAGGGGVGRGAGGSHQRERPRRVLLDTGLRARYPSASVRLDGAKTSISLESEAMAEQVGLLGRKLGMTQVFAPDGERVPVTVIQTGPCVVVGKRTPDKDGYSALQIGFEERPARLTNRPANGFFKKAGVKPQRFVREIRIPESELEKFELGQALKPSDLFVENNAVDVTGTSKGKGYQGVMKRHHMNGTKASHGVHEFFRHGGSIGCRLTPGRVHKGKRMAGQMGNEKVTLQNLQ